MAEPVRARRLSQDEGRRLQQIVRRGKHGSIRVRRALIIMSSASGTPVAAIARLVAADEDTVRDVIHAFNERGLAALDPRWAGGRPRLISDEDVAFIVTTATTRPKALGLPFTRWSVRKLAAYLSGCYRHTEPGRGGRIEPARRVRIGRERLRQVLHEHDVTFQRTRTWKESTDPDFDAKLDRIEHVTSAFADRCFAFDQFGPLSIRPHHGSGWARSSKPDRLPATYRRTHGIRYFHGCYSLADDQLWGVVRARKGGDHTLAALKSIRAARPDSAPIYVILDKPVREHHTRGAQVGGRAQGRVVPDSDLQLLGESDRGPVRAAAHVHDGELELPQPHRPGPGPAGPPALAQHPRPTPRRPGRPTPRTRPHPQRERPPLGPTQDQDEGRDCRRNGVTGGW
jgi:transposase